MLVSGADVFPTIENIIHVGLFSISVPNALVSGADVLNDLVILFLFQFGSLVYIS